MAQTMPHQLGETRTLDCLVNNFCSGLSGWLQIISLSQVLQPPEWDELQDGGHVHVASMHNADSPHSMQQEA